MWMVGLMGSRAVGWSGGWVVGQVVRQVGGRAGGGSGGWVVGRVVVWRVGGRVEWCSNG